MVMESASRGEEVNGDQIDVMCTCESRKSTSKIRVMHRVADYMQMG